MWFSVNVTCLKKKVPNLNNKMSGIPCILQEFIFISFHCRLVEALQYERFFWLAELPKHFSESDYKKLQTVQCPLLYLYLHLFIYIFSMLSNSSCFTIINIPTCIIFMKPLVLVENGAYIFEYTITGSDPLILFMIL